MLIGLLIIISQTSTLYYFWVIFNS